MYPQNEDIAEKPKWLRGRTLRIVTASVFFIALAVLSYFVWQLHSQLISLQDSLDTNAMSIESTQCSVEQLQRPAPVFTLASYETEYKKDEYGESYSGNLILACDQPEAFIIILKTALVSGGSAYTDADAYSMVIVQNGVGKYSTYDWGELGKITKPQYEFEVVGYFRAEQTPNNRLQPET